jgi:helicase-like protein
MPIADYILEELLARRTPDVPAFKGMDPARIKQCIRERTGFDLITKTEPRAHQLEGLGLAIHLERVLIYFGMRLGKSALALYWATHLRRSGLWRGRGLIVAHAPIGLSVWQEQADTHSHLKIRCVQNSADEFIDALNSDCDLVVVPRTGLQAMFAYKKLSVKKKRNKLYPDMELLDLAAAEFSLYISDEIHMAGNPTSLWFNIEAAIVRRCRFRMGLTGTPIGRDPFAIWGQAFLVDSGRTLGENYYVFEQAYGTKKRNWFSPRKAPMLNKKTGKMVMTGYDWVFDKNKMSVLTEKIASISMAYDFTEVRQVGISPSVVRLTMSKAQQDLYDQCINKVIKMHEFRDPQEIKNTFIRLRQIASGYIPYTDKSGVATIVRIPGSVKLEWLDEMLSVLPDDMQAVVFHDYTETGAMICERIKAAGITHGWIHGRVDSGRANTHEMHKFQKGESRVLVANAAVGSMAIDLRCADYLLFFESPTSYKIRKQAEARPLSDDRGTRAVIMDDLVCAPVEDRILGFLREGKDAVAAIMRNPRMLVS